MKSPPWLGGRRRLAGAFAVTGTSGPGWAFKQEAIGLGIMTEAW